MRPSYVILSLQVAFGPLACTPKSQDDTGVVSSSPSSSSTMDPSEGSTGTSACGDGVPSAGKFCFVTVGVPGLKSPLAAVGGELHEGPQVSFVALDQLTSELTTVDFIDGEMVTGTPVPVGFNPGLQLRLANFDGSGLPELVVADVGGNSKLLSNNGGVLGPVADLALPGITGLGLLVPIDINGDGLSEVIKGTSEGARLWIQTDGEWLLQEPSFEVAGCKVLWDAAVVDLNGDGLEDIAFVGSPGSLDEGIECDPLPLMKVTVLLSTGDSELLKEVASIPIGLVSDQIVAGDFNGDDIMDLAVASYLDQGVIALKGLGGGQFAAPVQATPDGWRVLAGDFDGDGYDELATNRYTAGSLVTEVWFVDGVFDERTIKRADGVDAPLLASADINADSVDDIAIVNIVESTAHVAILVSNP